MNISIKTVIATLSSIWLWGSLNPVEEAGFGPK